MRTTLRALLVLVLISHTAPLLADDRPKTWGEFSLIGRVRTLTESEVSDVTWFQPDGHPFHTLTTHFSTNGSLVDYAECVSTCDRSYYVWEAQRLVEQRNDSETLEREETVVYLYDTDGRVTEEQTVSLGILYKRTVHLRDGPRTEEIEYFGDSPFSRRVWQHDEVNGTDRIWLYSYQGDPRKEVLESQTEDRTIRFSDGSVRIEDASAPGSYFTVNDSNGRLLEEQRSGDNFFHHEKHRYDARGREIEKSEWFRDGTIINRRTYVYVDDAQGNWIRRTEYFWSSAYVDPAPTQCEVTIRKIDYY